MTQSRLLFPRITRTK